MRPTGSQAGGPCRIGAAAVESSRPEGEGRGGDPKGVVIRDGDERYRQCGGGHSSFTSITDGIQHLRSGM